MISNCNIHQPIIQSFSLSPNDRYFPPAISDQPQGQCGGGMLDPLDPANSPGLMAPQQLLARFGPRHCTESVEVPSSEHVAEIVGRQGKSQWELQKILEFLNQFVPQNSLPVPSHILCFALFIHQRC
jgi:hypothetical protein